MGESLLIEGSPRMGWFIDGHPCTPELAVMLQDTGKYVVLTVPTRGLAGQEDPYSRWFSSGIHFGDDPKRTRYSYKPPGVRMFHDEGGTVVLVGCRAAWMASERFWLATCRRSALDQAARHHRPHQEER